MRGYYLGIDGGGTKTQAVILDSSGCLKGVGTAGSSSVNNVGLEHATHNIQSAVAMAASEAGIAAHSFNAAFLGIAGVVSQADRDVVTTIAQQIALAPANMIGVDHDCRVALSGGLGGQPGIVQIIGTGSSCFGLTSTGDRWRAGGWGYLLADEGAGYWLGIQAMKAATSEYDTRGHPTLLTEMVSSALKLEDMDQIMQRMYYEPLSVADIAALSHLVIDAARQNDQVANAIITHGMDEVARCIEAVARRLRFRDDELRLVCVGGIVQAGPVITTPLEKAICRRLPTCKIEKPLFPASIGAGLLAHQLEKATIEPEFLETLTTSVQERR